MPSRTILDQFERAKTELAANPAFLGAWAPIIKQYAPGILEYCINGEKLAKGLVEDWLTKYMFAGQDDAAAKAKVAADFFANYSVHKSHSIGITREQARHVNVVVDDLERDQILQDRVLSVHHAVMITLQGPAVKLIENHLGRTFVTSQAQPVVQVMPPGPIVPFIVPQSQGWPQPQPTPPPQTP